MPANRFQIALLQSYPDIDLLPFDAADPFDVERAIKENTVGAPLFTFLWNELDDDCDSVLVADNRISSAIGDLMAVQTAIQDLELEPVKEVELEA